MRTGTCLLMGAFVLLSLSGCRGEEWWPGGGTPAADCPMVTEEDLRSCSLDAEDLLEPDLPDGSVGRSALSYYDDCDELLEPLRRAAIRQAYRSAESQYCSALRQVYRTLNPPEPTYGADGDVDADADGDIDGDADGDGAEEYSTTNNQEAGVDEADFVKNDGEHIYMVAGREFLIIRAWPADETQLISSFAISGTPRSMYVHGGHAFIYVYESVEGCDDWMGWNECGVQPSSLRVDVLDISDLEAPTLVRQISLEGSYVGSRRIGDAVHTAVRFGGIVQQWFQPRPANESWCGYDSAAGIRGAFLEALEEQVRVIEEMDASDWLPSVRDRRLQPDGTWQTETDLFQSCETMLHAERQDSSDMLTIFSVDMREQGELAHTTIIGEDGVVYASRNSLYVARSNNAFAGGDRETTTIHRFGLDSDGAPAAYYEGSGEVRGRILNQFSMGEHEGRLRIATTSGMVWDPDCSNDVSILELQEGELVVTGHVGGIAPSEDIRSARFVGDRGFIVTFKRTDPLFVLDLSDHTAPRIAGELHIPGFSTYMHLMDDDHLLTIGFDAEDDGEVAYFAGVQLQIFDVSDMSDPRLTHRETIGTRGTSSEATDDHLAFTYFRARDSLAIPMAICDGGTGGGSDGDEMTFNGLLVYDVTVEEGFGERGRISHGAPEGDSGFEYTCDTWWTNGTSRVKRSIYMEDYVYSIANTEMIVAHLDDLSTPLAIVDLPFLPPEEPEEEWRPEGD